MVPSLQGFRLEAKDDADSSGLIMVSQLIDHHVHAWKTNLVLHTFDLELAETILSIPISTRAKPDKLIWVSNPKGKFVVKSAYSIIIEENHIPSSLEFSWKKLWKVKAPEMVKTLL